MQPTTHAPQRIRALDGLRGLAVAGVLAYHCGFGWARGGFLGVSLFFTLSGFLITSLLLTEHAATGRIALGAFWARRARRLLPAAMVALGGIVAFGASVASGSQLRALRADVLGALGYAANWRFVAAGTSYGDLWSAPSPVQHFWSLAIEEQLYIVLPLMVSAALAIGRGRRRIVAAVLGVALALSVVATFSVQEQLRAYYGTDVRGAELLAGALLAVILSARPSFGRATATKLGPVALLLVLLAWSTTTQSDARLYDGGLLLHAALAVVVILAARVDGPLASALSLRPLRWLGRISYGAYLYHWPIFLWLTEARTGTSGVALAALRVGVSLALASLSARILEEPIRAARRLPTRTPVAFATAALTVVAALMLVTTTTPSPVLDVDLTAASPSLVAPPVPAAASITTSTSTSMTRAAAVATASAAPVAAEVPRAPGEPLRVYVAGDSNAFILGMKMQKWGTKHDVAVWASGWFACHIVPGGTYRWAGQPKHTEQKCNDWRTTRAADLAAIRPHVVIVIYGSFDLLDRRWDGSDTWTHVGRPDFDRLLLANIEEMTDLLGSGGARVLWATYPRTRTGVIDGVAPERDHPEVDSHRVDRLNTLIRQAAAARPFAGVIDLRRYMQSWPKGELDPVKRPDGIHPSDPEAANIAAWMGGQVLVDASR